MIATAQASKKNKPRTTKAGACRQAAFSLLCRAWQGAIVVMANGKRSAVGGSRVGRGICFNFSSRPPGRPHPALPQVRRRGAAGGFFDSQNVLLRRIAWTGRELLFQRRHFGVRMSRTHKDTNCRFR